MIGVDAASHMARRFGADVIQLRPRNVVIPAGTNDVPHMLGQGKDEDQIVRLVAAALRAAARATGVPP